jgi:glycosyltransferase involved in cell wall biosynthesis
MGSGTSLVQVRTPTYKRPDALRRALRSVLDQSWPDWIVDVYDDDPQQAGRPVCAELADPRIRYHHNTTQRFASKNIDACFSAANPADADYFCVLEDDNFLLPDFFTENIALCRTRGVEIVLRNQLVEYASGTPNAHLGAGGVLDDLFVEDTYDAAQFRMSLLVGIGVSNGGLFWSRNSTSKLEIGFGCTATMQEYMRTFSVNEPIHVAMTPLAVWAENAAQTTRNAGLRSSYLRRELDLKRQIQALQRIVWTQSQPEARRQFLSDPHFVAPAALRARSLVKALIAHPSRDLALRDAVEMALRGVAIRTLGRLSAEFQPFVQSRLVAHA